MADYGNIFSPDYWTPEGYQWRAGSRKSSAHDLAIQQEQAKQDQFGAVGDFFGGIGKGIGDWWNNTVAKPTSDQTRRDVLQNIAPHPSSPQLERTGSSNPFGMMQRDGGDPNEVSNIFKALSGGFNTPEAQTPYNNSVEAMPEPEPSLPDATSILERLNERFNFDPSSVDTSPLDSVLQNNLSAVNGARTAANDNFAKSDSNIKGMFGAHERDIRNDNPDIQARGDQFAKNQGAIFDKTIAANNAGLAADRRENEEMLKRLGIAPAANQPDLVGQAVAEGNNVAQQSRDARVAEANSNTQTNISRNNTLASAVGNDGLQRRSDLNMRLQDILGDLGNKETDYRNEFQQNKLDLMQRAEDKSYDRWLQDRQFDMGLFNSINQANSSATADEADRQNRLEIAQIQAGARNNGASGSSTGWIQGKSPGFRNAFFDVAQRVNISQDPQKAIQMLADPKYGLDPTEVVTAITDYANLGRVKAENF